MVNSNTAVSGGKQVQSMQSLVENKYMYMYMYYCKSSHLLFFHFFEAPNDDFEVQLFQGFISTPYERHRYRVAQKECNNFDS